MVSGRRCAVLVVLAMFVGCGSGGDGQQQAGRGRRGGGQRNAAAVPVKVEAIQRRDISNYILANTTLEAFQWVDVRSRTSGQVVSILKEEGDLVKIGTVIARLDAEAARLQVKQMEVAYEDARRVFEREEQLFERKLASSERYENAKTQVDRTLTQLEQARLNLSYTSIVSPVEGTLTIRNVEVGNMVTANQALFSVADFDPLLARIRIPEKNIGKVVVGQRARISVESAPNKIFYGRVTMISPVVNPESGTIKVTIEIPGKGNEILRPGMFASVYIITETHAKALVIPKKALVLEGEGNQIFVYEKDAEGGMGKAMRKKVEVGFSDNEWLEIRKGVVEGEQVITVGHEGLRPGTAVRLVGEGAAAGEQSGGRDGTQGNGGDAEQIKAMQGRMFGRFPELKKEYETRVKKDPELATRMEKWRAFMGEMREKGILPAGGGRPQ